jgi:membrane protein implicated in regulation of membrane protease activity
MFECLNETGLFYFFVVNIFAYIIAVAFVFIGGGFNMYFTFFLLILLIVGIIIHALLKPVAEPFHHSFQYKRKQVAGSQVKENNNKDDNK